MALKYSQGACEWQAGKVKATITAATIAFVDGGGSSDTITDSGNGFVTAGFTVGDWAEIHNAATAGNNKQVPLIAVAAGTLTIPTASIAAEVAGATITIEALQRGTLRDLLYNSTLSLFAAAQAATPDSAEPGTELVCWTGLQFGSLAWDSTDKYAYVSLYSGLSPLVNAAASGTAQSFRLYLDGGAKVTGASTTARRLDGTVGITSGDLRVADTAIVSGTPQSITSLALRVPQVVPAS